MLTYQHQKYVLSFNNTNFFYTQLIMYKITCLLLSIPLFATVPSFAQTSDSNMAIILVDASGEANFDGTDYPDKVTMTENSDGSFAATSVKIDNGFYFLGYSTTAATGTLYTLSSWAQNPPVQLGPNPLSITTGSAKNYISLSAGTYDITFIPTSVSATSLRMFSIVPSDGNITEPSYIFLAQGKSASACTRISGESGIYTAMAGYPAGAFKISYEPRNDYEQFIYGPADASDATITESKTIALKRGVNTDVSFTIPDEYKGHKITISLEPGNEYLLLGEEILTGVSSINDNNDGNITVYTAAGIEVGTMQESDMQNLPGNLYFVRHSNGTVTKTVVRR